MTDVLNRLIDLLAPHLDTVPHRQAQLRLAYGFDAAILRRIPWEGDTQTFVVHCAHVLHQERVLDTLLQFVRTQTGTDKQPAFDALSAELAALTTEAFAAALAEKLKTRVFLSYARADDDPNYDDPAKSFLRRLYNRLHDEGFEVWWDREKLPSRGETFTAEIESAIRATDRFVLIVGPGAVASEYVSAEWRCALGHCLPVTPVLRAGDYGLIPADIGAVNAIDCRPTRDENAALSDLVNRLREAAHPLGLLANVPRLPGAFVLREKPFHAARDAIRADAIQPVVVSAPPRATAVYGYGGIGKSTLAAALAQDCDVRRRFKDGVYWLEIGQKPIVASRQADLGMLLGDNREQYQDETSGKMRLSLLLADKQALLVLDDVWDHGVVEKFPIGSACRVLLTTRSKQIAKLIDGKDVPLDLLTPAEGAHLIAARTGGNPDDATYRQIAEELGGLTLAIVLAATQIVEGYADNAADLLRLLKKHGGSDNPFADLVVKDEDKNLNLEKSLSLSYEALSADLKWRFRALGILALEGTFDRAMAAALWNDADEDDARKPLTDLVRNGLVEALTPGPSPEGEGSLVRYTLHRLLRAYARALLIRAGELDSAFGRYADRVTAEAEPFNNDKPETWHTFEADLAPHLLEVGDELARRMALTPRPPAHEGRGKNTLIDLALAFALNIKRYLFRRQEVRRIGWLDMGLTAARKKGDKGLEALFLNDLAVNWRALGETRKALEYYKQALPLRRAVGNRGGEAATLVGAGYIWSVLGDKHRALDCFEQALPLFRTVGDRGGEAATLAHIGEVRRTLGETRKALDYYEQALLLFRTVGDRDGEAVTLNSIGLGWSALGEKRKALDYYEQALPLFRAVGDRGGEAATLNNIGHAWNAPGEKHKALDYYEQALPLMRAAGDHNGEASILNNMSFIYLQEGNLEKTFEIQQQIIAIVRATGDAASEALYLYNIAAVYQRMGRLDEALQSALAGKAILVRYNLPQNTGGGPVADYDAFIAQVRRERDGGSPRQSWLGRLGRVFRPRGR